MESIISFFTHPFFSIFGGISAFIICIGFLLNFLFWLLGIAPLLFRLGYGRWSRKIAIGADVEKFESLKKDLIESGIFRKRNLHQFTSTSLSNVREHDLLLVDYDTFNESEIETILSQKRSRAGLIIYFPKYSAAEGRIIPEHIRTKINSLENTTIVNFRGRLLNDIVTTLITTSYRKN